MSSSDRLLGIRAKIEWAKEHILKLEMAIRRFFDGKPYEVGANRDPNTRRVSHYVKRIDNRLRRISHCVSSERALLSSTPR